MLSSFKNQVVFKIFILSLFMASVNLFSSTAYGIECVGSDGCPKQVIKIHRFARNGSPDAQLLLAALYEDGNLIVKNDKKAFSWYRKATKQPRGISIAFFKVGVAYLMGKGTTINIEKGIKYITKAAKHNHVNSQLLLGFFNYNGENLKKNLVKARYWFKKAAESRDPRAAYALAQMLESGLGGKQNTAEAKKWYLVAAAKGYKNATQRITDLKPSDAEVQAKVQLVSNKKSHSQEKGNILTTYADSMNETQMMNIVLENIKEANLFSGPRTGSRIPGHGCGDNRRNCVFITDQRTIFRFMGVY